MIDRAYRKLLQLKLANNPAVALLGPRQCGKTTLAKTLGGNYFDMENEGSVLRLDVEWHSVVGGQDLVVLDEVQRVPEIFSRLRGAIDADRKRNGRFLLLGSVSPAIMRGVSESLAGRLGLLSMGPLGFVELLDALGYRCLDALWLRGGFPDGGILDAGRFPEWEEDYLEILSTRDLPDWGFPAKPQKTKRLLAMLAAMHGQPQNASEIAASMGLDHKTILGYCDFLEETFLIRRLRPWFTNIGKRLVKTPRIYWRDTGLLHALLHVRNLEHLYSLPIAGYSWEGFVIEQILCTLKLYNIPAEPYFFRTSDGMESDLVLDFGGELWAVEIKLTSNPTSAMVNGLRKAADLIKATRRILICKTEDELKTDDLLVTNLPQFLKSLL
jgi:predicted AAA+ superfamily ATPase